MPKLSVAAKLEGGEADLVEADEAVAHRQRDLGQNRRPKCTALYYLNRKKIIFLGIDHLHLGIDHLEMSEHES